ncbi:MAG TPA: hypothetical protein VMX18_01950 [Candidatus Bipolaricaulota bacterium]|nr:hypothetical protein [Candidatus Bipolaricaulota bacterium]
MTDKKGKGVSFSEPGTTVDPAVHFTPGPNTVRLDSAAAPAGNGFQTDVPPEARPKSEPKVFQIDVPPSAAKAEKKAAATPLRMLEVSSEQDPQERGTHAVDVRKAWRRRQLLAHYDGGTRAFFARVEAAITDFIKAGLPRLSGYLHEKAGEEWLGHPIFEVLNGPCFFLKETEVRQSGPLGDKAFGLSASELAAGFRPVFEKYPELAHLLPLDVHMLGAASEALCSKEQLLQRFMPGLLSRFFKTVEQYFREEEGFWAVVEQFYQTAATDTWPGYEVAPGVFIRGEKIKAVFGDPTPVTAVGLLGNSDDLGLLEEIMVARGDRFIFELPLTVVELWAKLIEQDLAKAAESENFLSGAFPAADVD